MVPLYQIGVDAAVAAVLFFFALYSSLVLKKPLNRALEVGFFIAGIILLCGIFYAARFGHWPFRG